MELVSHNHPPSLLTVVADKIIHSAALPTILLGTILINEKVKASITTHQSRMTTYSCQMAPMVSTKEQVETTTSSLDFRANITKSLRSELSS